MFRQSLSAPPEHLELDLLTRLQALARAAYARCEIVLLDDSFSALDGKTESCIVKNLLGPGGLFRQMRTTVFLITNSGTSKLSSQQVIRMLILHSCTLLLGRLACCTRKCFNQISRNLG
jgi:ABC-type methionine transport system ATPase subunit